MEFCDDCGSIMLPSKIDGKIVFKCKCGAVKSFDKEKSKAYKVTKTIEHSIREEVTNLGEVMEWKEKNLRSSIKNFKCSRCGYDKAHLETRQTRSADEGMTHFITCLKCGKMRKIGS
jgi:DNA-directed RNA polymerase subunit M/transcription elongation factor TFIIS